MAVPSPYTPNPWIIASLIAFGTLSIGALCLLQWARFRSTRPKKYWNAEAPTPARVVIESFKYQKFSINFLVIVGLISVVVVAAVLVLANAPSEALSPAFTLFGTIAGYLATRRLTHGAEDDPEASPARSRSRASSNETGSSGQAQQQDGDESEGQ